MGCNCGNKKISKSKISSTPTNPLKVKKTSKTLKTREDLIRELNRRVNRG